MEINYGKIDKADLITMAAFIDGEGWVYIYNSKTKSRKGDKIYLSYSVDLGINLVDKFKIEEFKQKFGGDITIVKPKKENNQYQYRWRIHNNTSAKEFLQLIYPYLIIKKYPVKLAIEFCDKYLNTDISEQKQEIGNYYKELISSYSLRGINNGKNCEYPTMNYDEAKIYVAAFMDGEGCIRIKKQKYKTVHGYKPTYTTYIVVANTNQLIINWIKDMFGGRIWCQNRKNEKWKPCYMWNISSTDAGNFLKMLLPYISLKREQALVCIEHQDFVDAKGYKRMNKEYMNQKLENREKIRILNKRGI